MQERERSADGAERHRFRYRWIIQIDEDVAFNTISSFSTFLEAAQSALPEHARSHTSCYGRCVPPGLVDISSSDCQADLSASEV